MPRSPILRTSGSLFDGVQVPVYIRWRQRALFYPKVQADHLGHCDAIPLKGVCQYHPAFITQPICPREYDSSSPLVHLKRNCPKFLLSMTPVSITKSLRIFATNCRCIVWFCINSANSWKSVLHAAMAGVVGNIFEKVTLPYKGLSGSFVIESTLI